MSRISDHAAKYSVPGVQLQFPETVSTQRSILLGVQCPRYECVPKKVTTSKPIVKLPSICTYEGNTLVTFDKTTFIKDVCYHTLYLDQKLNVKVQCKYDFFQI